jgi:CO/xanthine dehydrogenase FAD-binding subunit
MTEFDYLVPRRLGEAVSLLRRYGKKAALLAGGTDLMLRVERRAVAPGIVVDLKQIPDLKGIKSGRDGLRIGSLALMEEITSQPSVRKRYGLLATAAGVVGSMQTRNRATLGGNLCNASPAADTPPALIALAAIVKIAGGKRVREVPIEDFFLGPGKTCLRSGELVKELFIPSPARGSGTSFQRSTRTAMDIALVNCAVYLHLGSHDGIIKDIRIALGAVAPTPLRARDAEEALRGTTGATDNIEQAVARAVACARPIDDVRASADYRREMVRVLSRRAIVEAHRQAKGEI